jgi:5-methylcytosine-specific restriction enzyme A
MRETLLQISNQYTRSKSEKFAKHPTVDLIRTRLREEMKLALGPIGSGLVFEASAGAGRWAFVPWAGVLNPLVTNSATKGYYVVYLFSAEQREIHLSLNQGATSIIEEFGTRGRELLKDRATFMRARLSDYSSKFRAHSISLGYDSNLPRGYEAGHVLGKTYHVASLPSEESLIDDLQTITRAYLALTFRGGQSVSLDEGELSLEEIPASVTEVKRYSLHRRIDRHPEASKAAKRYHGTVCQGCNLSFASTYGEIGEGFIEAHHLRPLSSLEEGVLSKYDVATDFAVLCSNCHRMIHRMPDPSDLRSFKDLISSQTNHFTDRDDVQGNR